MFLKILIAGDGATGKTTISKKLNGTLKEQQELIMTPGIDFHTLEISEDNSEAVIWDLGGQQQFRSFQDSFFTKADIVILVFDVSFFETFLNIDSWLSMVNRDKVSQIYLIGNKVDLDNRAVTREEAEQYAKGHSLDYFEISALTDTGFEEFKNDLLENAMNKAKVYQKESSEPQDFLLNEMAKERV